MNSKTNLYLAVKKLRDVRPISCRLCPFGCGRRLVLTAPALGGYAELICAAGSEENSWGFYKTCSLSRWVCQEAEQDA